MLFNSWEFVFLVVATISLYYLPLLRSVQIPILIISSFVFYAYSQPLLLFLLIFTILFISFFSHAVYYSYGSKFRSWMVIGVFSSVVILAFFKYGPLFAKTFSAFLFSNDYMNLLLLIPLPIGISFFTFEGISLIVDAYRYQRSGDKPFDLQIKPAIKSHLMNTAFFVSFFPHLIAGPIIKAHQLFPQIKVKYFRDIDVEYAFKTLTLGYFLKMVIADNLKDQTFWIIYPYFKYHSSLTLSALLFGYSIQIFADFAGYSLIALGTASLFGYRLPVNFNFPYIARSFSEFWQRWHISLSSWLKEYLYIPLGGNRKRTLRIYINIMIVMLLGGLWHGAAWSYAVWGGWHGLLLVLERALKKAVSPRFEGILWKGLCMSLVFTMVTVSWLLFKLPDFRHVLMYFQSMASNLHYNHEYRMIGSVLVYSIPVILYHSLYLFKENESIKSLVARYEHLAYGCMIFLIILNSGTVNEFIYFQF